LISKNSQLKTSLLLITIKQTIKIAIMKIQKQALRFLIITLLKKQCFAFTSFLFCIALFFSAAVRAQDPAQYGTPFGGVPDTRDVNMYQAHIRPYSAAGNLAGVTARLDAIKALGINVIYLMPVYPHGTDSRSSASPYSIKDFKSVASEYGTLTDMRTLVDGAHSRGMAVILDFAVNGTSWDHPWISQHPDWYNQSGGVIQQLASFPDVAGLNFSNTAMRAALVDAMRYWIFAANIDGYRCDFANNPPLDFWTNTINNLRGITAHKLLMFAEGDRLENFQTGFDMNFGDKWYYDAIKPIANGTSVSQIQTTTNTEYTYATGSQQVVRYTANHDTETGETAIGVFKSHAGVVVNFLVSAYMRGVPFLTSGQEVDFNQTIPWPYTTVKINFGANTGAAADFTKVLNFRNSSNAVRRGTMTNYSDANVCAFTKTSGTEKVVVIANLRNSTQNYVIPSALAGSYKDAYSGTAVTLSSGAAQSLAAFQYIVLTNAGTGGCTSTAITPYLQVNGGAWQQTATASLAAGGSVILGPQPLSGGSWSWSGPGGFSAATREITLSSIQTSQAGNYVATYTNPSGCTSTQTFTITVTGGGTTYYQIVNRWQANTYLYDGGNGQVKYGTNPGTNTLYQWAQVDAGSGYVLLKNRSTGKLMHVENQNGSVQCDAANTTWYSAMWSIAATGDGWNYIQNRWQPSERIHLENLLGYAQYSGSQTGWYSAMWQFVNPVTARPVNAASSIVVTDNEDAAGLKLFPNPVQGRKFYVVVPGLSQTEKASVTINDITGKQVLTTKISGIGEIEHHLSAGVYFVTIRSKQTNVTKKIVIK